ncbi:MAG: PIN domain-containing protein [Candidatus Electrothrix sp. EH2]|nr:PIN domain-containing protein [Candidatus Electrothrix sp. EH2]
MKYFLDTSYLIAITHKRDQYHEKAAAVSKTLEKPVRLVTTSAVLMEFGNMLSSVRLRSKAFNYIRLLKNDVYTQVVPVSEQLFESGLTMFGKYHDKEWGLVDCISFLVMKERGITRALSSDVHFEQAGFTRCF